jgi:DNA helicase HerA-like ATPase
MRSPRLYATFLLWLLSELFEQLPEVGDPEKPKLVFFFDEAHLLFNNAPKELLTAIEQVVRLIRSKGVGVYFVTQNPLDVPEAVLGQLGNRMQHALRAFTPRDQKAVKAAAETFRQNPSFDTATTIMELGVGEALVSMLEDKGTPGMVARTLVAPPASRVGPITPEERQSVIGASPLRGKYDTSIDRQSAFEVLRDRASGRMANAGAAPANPPANAPVEESAAGSGGGILGQIGGMLGGILGGGSSQPAGGRGRQRMSTGELVMRSAIQSAARSAGTQITRAVLRGILGGMTR